MAFETSHINRHSNGDAHNVQERYILLTVSPLLLS
jgi:hypothetical protein